MMAVGTKRKKVILTGAVILIAIFALWGYRFRTVNDVKYRPTTEIYEMGEVVDIGENYFFDVTENPDGYTLRVDNAEVKSFTEYVDNLGGIPFDDKWYYENDLIPPTYVYDLTITIANNGNSDGYIFCGKYAMYSKSLGLQMDLDLWEALAPHMEGSPAFTIRENTEVTLNIAFTASAADQLTNSDDVDKRIKNDDFYFCISEFPVRKMIRISTNEVSN